ncbi:beta- -endoglucanase, partial [Lasius niger]
AKRECVLDGADQTAKLLHKDCDNRSGIGCQAEERSGGILGSETGGTQALEWTSEYIKIYTWPLNAEPADIRNSKEKPDTATWGKPSVHLKTAFCDIDQAFQEQRIMFSLAFCGKPVAEDHFWNEERRSGGQTCREATGMTCKDYVAHNPGDFQDFYFRIKNIQYFSETNTEPSKTSTDL